MRHSTRLTEEEILTEYRKLPEAVAITVRRSASGFSTTLRGEGGTGTVHSATYDQVPRDVTLRTLESTDIPRPLWRYMPSFYLPVEESFRLWSGLDANDEGMAVLIRPPEL